MQKNDWDTPMSAIRLEVLKGQTTHSNAIDQVLHALANLRYGSVEIVVHDGRITQIERHEKIRIGGNSELKSMLTD
jgi:hypothetical protein